MKKIRTYVLLTLAVTFLTSDFVQAQWWRRSRPQRTTSTQTVTPQTSGPQATLQDANDGWSAWKPIDRRSREIFESLGISDGINRKPLKYCVSADGSRYKITVQAFNNPAMYPNRRRTWTETHGYIIQPDGSVEPGFLLSPYERY